jgi:hypothetical protein
MSGFELETPNSLGILFAIAYVEWPPRFYEAGCQALPLPGSDLEPIAPRALGVPPPPLSKAALVGSVSCVFC